MTGIGLGLAALAATSLMLWRSIGPAWLNDRLAAILALLGAQAVVAPTQLGTWARQLADWIISVGQRVIAGADVQVASAAAAVAVPLIVAGTGLVWVAAMLPSKGRWVAWLGDIVGLTFSKELVWGGGLVLGVFAAAAPGPWGQMLQAITTALADAGESAIRAVLSGR